MENDGLDIFKLSQKKDDPQEPVMESSLTDTKTSTLSSPLKQSDQATTKKTEVQKKAGQPRKKQTPSKKEKSGQPQQDELPSQQDNHESTPLHKKEAIDKNTAIVSEDSQAQHKSTAKRSAELKEKFNEIARREKKKINASNRNFIVFLTKFFFILMAAGCLFMFIVYNGLQTYEKKTPNGAMMEYVSLLRQQKYDEIYSNSSIGFTQLNQKEDYIAYLKEVYGDVDLKNAVFSKKAYSNSTFLYYDLIVDGTTLSTLELLYLSEDQYWLARTVVSLRNFYIDVVNEASVVVNEVQLDNTYRTEENVPANNYDNLFDTRLAPTISRYHIDNLVAIPQISLQDNEKYKVVKDAIRDQFYVGYSCREEFLTIATNLIRTTATTYARYISEDAKFDELRALLYKRSDFYKTISEFNNRYFSTHDSYRFDSVQVSDVVSFGQEEGFIGTISFDYTVTIDKEKLSKTYANTYQLTFLKVDGKWLCSNISIATQQEQ